jgi:FkbM family methyltransferase
MKKHITYILAGVAALLIGIILGVLAGIKVMEGKQYYEALHVKELRQARSLLQDARSRKVFDESVRLYNRENFWGYPSIQSLIESKQFKPMKPAKYEQYYHPIVQAEAGDTMIDAGAMGFTYVEGFLKNLGPDGRTICFEPNPNEYQALVKHFQGRKNVKIYPWAIYDKPGTMMLELDDNGGSSFLWQKDKSVKVKVVTLDGFVKQNKIDKVDFIKMDIEGAELGALKGAENILRKDKPKLAISAYHQVQDLYELILYINSLDLGYKFWLETHYPDFWSERVLYAKVEK